MNGNELANILERGEWAYEEYFKIPEPTESYRHWYKRRYGRYPEDRLIEAGKAESNINFLADILSSEDYMMMNPLDRAKVVEVMEKIQREREKAQREEEKAEAERQREAKEAKAEEQRGIWAERRVLGAIESAKLGRISEEKLAAILHAEGYPIDIAESLIEAREKEKEARRARIKEIDILGRELQKEKKAEEKEAKEKAAEWAEKRRIEIAELMERDREREEKEKEAREERIREMDKIGREEADKRYERRIDAIKYEDERKDIDREYRLNVEKFDEEKAKNLREHKLDKLKEKHKWEKTQFNMGFKDKEFQELSKQFWETLDFNKEKEQLKAEKKELQLEFDKEKEANVMTRFEKTLEREYDQLNLDIKKFGLTKDIEARIEQMALLKYALDTKKLGEKEAARKWEEKKLQKEWWFKEKEIPIKEVDALSRFLNATKDLATNTKSDGFAIAVNKFLAERLGEDVVTMLEELEKEEKAQMEIPAELSINLDSLGADTKDKAIEWLTAAYNSKTKKIYKPNVTEQKDLGKFFLGDPEKEPKELNIEKLGCNLSENDFIKAVAKEPFWSDALKGLIIRMRYDPDIWAGIQSKANEKGVLILSDEEFEKPKKLGIFGKIGAGLMGVLPALGIARVKEWYPFKEPTEIPAKDIRSDLESILIKYGQTITRGEARGYLREKGYSYEEIDTLFGE
jgi:hypothetical protein